MKQILTCTKKNNSKYLEIYLWEKIIAFNLIYGKLDTKSKQL